MPEAPNIQLNKPKIGLVQSRGIGDIVIALPIAKHWADAGYEVFWPIDERFISSFGPAVDYVNFIPFPFQSSFDGFVLNPLKLLKPHGCERSLILYSYISNSKVSNPVLFGGLKFDEYKYAVAEVPFAKKWNLSLRRNREREQALYDRVVRQPNYIVTHLNGSNCTVQHKARQAHAGFQVIEIDEQSDSIFDWLLVLERAAYLAMVDSCFANLVEQLNIMTPKTLYLRSSINFTPVYRNGWKFEAGIPAK